MKKTVIETELDLSSVGHLMVEVRNGLKDINKNVCWIVWWVGRKTGLLTDQHGMLFAL